MSNERTLDDDDLTANEAEGEARITMEMLHAVDGEESLSQRGLAARLNIALGF